MSVRVTSDIFVGALTRSARSGGGFAYVARRGNEQAGAILVAFFDPEAGSYALYRTVPHDPGQPDEGRDSRRFALAQTLEDESALRTLVERESRFDPDFWLVEIENWRASVADLLPVSDD